MQMNVYEDFKYCIQDSNCLYVGAKYTFAEIMENEDILFKFRKAAAESLLPGSDKDDTLETFLYYLEPHDFRIQVLKQMRSKVRVSTIKEKKGLFGKTSKEYVSSYITVPQLVSMSKEDKEAVGMVIQELRINKLALLTV